MYSYSRHFNSATVVELYPFLLMRLGYRQEPSRQRRLHLHGLVNLDSAVLSSYSKLK